LKALGKTLDPEYFNTKDVLFDKLSSDTERTWCFAINF